MNSKLLEECVNDWIVAMEITNVSKHTITAYKSDVLSFLEYCKEKNFSLPDLELSDMRDYVVHCLEVRRNTPKSVKRYIASIRSFMNWMIAESKLLHNPVEDVKIKRTGRTIPVVVSQDDMNTLLDQPDPILNAEIWLWKRDKAMMEVMYSSGVRVGELVNLDLKDIQIKNKLIRINKGKGGKDRVIPLGRKACEAITEWLIFREEKKPSNTKLFINQHGNSITIQQVRNRVIKQAKRAGLDAKVFPHLFRHCFATHMLSASNDLRAVQEMLGHKDISSTEVYTHADFETLAWAYDNFHPRAFKQ